jgi:hypothetical protein
LLLTQDALEREVPDPAPSEQLVAGDRFRQLRHIGLKNARARIGKFLLDARWHLDAKILQALLDETDRLGVLGQLKKQFPVQWLGAVVRRGRCDPCPECRQQQSYLRVGGEGQVCVPDFFGGAAAAGSLIAV